MDLKELLNQTTLKTTPDTEGGSVGDDDDDVNSDSVVSDSDGVISDGVISDSVISDSDGVISDGVISDGDVGVSDGVISDGVISDGVNKPCGDVSISERFKQPWNKLEKGMKMNRIVLFVEREKSEHTLSDIQSNNLKQLLFKGCEGGLFNRISEVKYNQEEYMIESFKALEFNESSKKYKLKTISSKNRSVSKSRSNIDRLMKKK